MNKTHFYHSYKGKIKAFGKMQGMITADTDMLSWQVQ